MLDSNQLENAPNGVDLTKVFEATTREAFTGNQLDDAPKGISLSEIFGEKARDLLVPA